MTLVEILFVGGVIGVVGFILKGFWDAADDD
jgi:hypothetical protein